MTAEKAFYTKTMADIYVDQNNFEKAAEIYRYLLKHDPDNEDFSNALSRIDEQLSMRARERIDLLFEDWIALLFQQDMQKKLKRLKNLLK